MYNKRSIFSNLQDNASDLGVILSNNFEKCTVRVIGSVAPFPHPEAGITPCATWLTLGYVPTSNAESKNHHHEITKE